MFRSVSEGFYKQNYEFVLSLLTLVAKKYNIKIDDWDLKSMEESSMDNAGFGYSAIIGQTSKDKCLYLSTKRQSVEDGIDYVSFICCHELGHIRQYNNGYFDKYNGNIYKGVDQSNIDYLSRPEEQDATLFSLKTKMFDPSNIKDETFKEAILQLYIDKVLAPAFNAALSNALEDV